MRQQSIQVVAKRNDKGKWEITNDMGLTLSMAPPMYEEVVGTEEEDLPPAYDTVTTLLHNGRETPNRNSANGYTIVECYIENGETVCQPISVIAEPRLQADDSVTDGSQVAEDNTQNEIISDDPQDNSPIKESVENEQNNFNESKHLADHDSDSASGCSSSSNQSTINNNGPNDRKIGNGKISNGIATNGHCNGIPASQKISNGQVRKGSEQYRKNSGILLDNEIEYIDDDEITEECV